jgi:hypothetical protein
VRFSTVIEFAIISFTVNDCDIFKLPLIF